MVGSDGADSANELGLRCPPLPTLEARRGFGVASGGCSGDRSEILVQINIHDENVSGIRLCIHRRCQTRRSGEDPRRFHPDSYCDESCGVAAPSLVGWVNASHTYVKRINDTLRCPARNVIADVLKAEETKVESFRIKANFEKRKVASSTLSAKCNVLRKDLIENELQLGELKHALAKGEDMLRFVQELVPIEYSADPA